MKDKIQIGLLAVIAVALAALAIQQFSGEKGAEGAVAANTTASTPAATPSTFDPMAKPAEAVDNTPKTTITFAEFEHDFGNIKQDSENKKVFTFTNTGTEPLIIEAATISSNFERISVLLMRTGSTYSTDRNKVLRVYVP